MVISQKEIVLVMAGIFLLLALAVLFMMVKVFAPWIRAFTSGVPLSVLQIIGMRLRKTDVQAVVRALIMANQAGVPVPSADMERAYLQGVDLEKVTLAFIQAKKKGMEITFQELVEAELDNRLQEKLGIRKEGRY
jgi:uncharacterized protein YqfA (UPF0365 family)